MLFSFKVHAQVRTREISGVGSWVRGVNQKLIWAIIISSALLLHLHFNAVSSALFPTDNSTLMHYCQLMHLPWRRCLKSQSVIVYIVCHLSFANAKLTFQFSFHLVFSLSLASFSKDTTGTVCSATSVALNWFHLCVHRITYFMFIVLSICSPE